MARMSIDDSVLRDTRVKRLAKALGWSRRETIGALLDVWAICYDRATPVLHEADVNEAAEADTFCANMVESGLACFADASGHVRISGVEDRIAYLSTKQKAGQKGGVRSGESRRSKREARASFASKQTFAEPEARANPSALPSALPSAPVPDASLASAPANDGPAEARAITDRSRALAARVRSRRLEAASSLWEAGIGQGSPRPAMMADASVEAQALRLVQQWSAEARASGSEPEATVAERAEHLIAVLVAQCETRGDLGPLRETTCWSANVVDWALATTPDKARAASLQVVRGKPNEPPPKPRVKFA